MAVTIQTVRPKTEQDRIDALKAEARDLVVRTSYRPGPAKLLRIVCFLLLDQMADMPGAEVRLRKTLEGLRLYANYKANRRV